MKKANKDSVSQLVLDAIDQNKDASHVRRRAMKQSVNILLNPSTEAMMSVI
jgi:hypothetical protein